MQQPKPDINLDPEWLSLIGQKYDFTYTHAPHPMLRDIGVMMVTAVVFVMDELPELGLWSPEAMEMVYYYPVRSLQIRKEPGSATQVPKSLLTRAGIYEHQPKLSIGVSR